MTYQTGAAVDLEDLLSQLDTFAVTTHGGWLRGYPSNPQTTDGWFELHKGSLSFSAKYPVGAQSPPQHMSVHHADGYIGTTTAPGAHTNDSGNGYNATTTGHTNSNLNGERCVSEIGNGPYPSYSFFADDTATHDYIHVVVETSTGVFRHLNFGRLVKFGDNWVGGEYVCGHYQTQTLGATALHTNHVMLLDGLAVSSASRLRASTVRIASGLANQSPAIWGVSMASSSLLTDTAGAVRRQIHGGFRSGMDIRGFGMVVGNGGSGLVGLNRISAYYRDPNNARVQLMGYMPDIAVINNRNFEPGQSVIQGGDTWFVFPMASRTLAVVAGASQFFGIAYRQVL